MTEDDMSEHIRNLQEQTHKYNEIKTNLHELKNDIIEMKETLQKLETDSFTEKESSNHYSRDNVSIIVMGVVISVFLLSHSVGSR